MCRNIKNLYNFKPPATEEEIRASSLQFVRKVSGFNKPSKANEDAFNRAVEQVAREVDRLAAEDDGLAVIVLAYDILVTVKGVTATVLLGRGASIWVENVIVFSLWYWHFDRGGPAERAAGSPIPPSFAFPENATPELAPVGWRPAYPDYLYLAYTNATAFSPTDTLPVRRWAKLTMMVQSTLSLVIAILVVARAVNVLPG